MPSIAERTIVHAVRDAAHRLAGEADDFAPLLDRIGDSPYVLIGEASHGTHEFYKIRSEITKRLIETRGFTAVAVEADWPDAYRVNQFVRDIGGDADATEALAGFRRFPQWMWRNADVLDFVGWLRAHNDAALPGSTQTGFYGLDLYSLHASIEAVLRYLMEVDPAAARRAMDRYSCFDHFGGDPQAYGHAASLGLSASCEREAIEQLVELRRVTAERLARGMSTTEDLFFAAQNARVVRNAERYYRAMFADGYVSWNLRDEHMAETLEELTGHLGQAGEPPKVVVWAHNSHLGDARATEMGAAGGELNLGQLVRQRHAAECVLVGFTTYEGTVTAASNWDEPAERKAVRPALPESVEALFHSTGIGNFFLDFAKEHEAAEALKEPRLERAIGVIYRPRTERQSHYFWARVSAQFDAVFHYDRTRAVEPLERTGLWDRGEIPETYPTAL